MDSKKYLVFDCIYEDHFLINSIVYSKQNSKIFVEIEIDNDNLSEIFVDIDSLNRYDKYFFCKIFLNSENGRLTTDLIIDEKEKSGFMDSGCSEPYSFFIKGLDNHPNFKFYNKLFFGVERLYQNIKKDENDINFLNIKEIRREVREFLENKCEIDLYEQDFDDFHLENVNYSDELEKLINDTEFPFNPELNKFDQNDMFHFGDTGIPFEKIITSISKEKKILLDKIETQNNMPEDIFNREIKTFLV